MSDFKNMSTFDLNNTDFIRETLLIQLGSTLLLDSLYLYAITLFGFFGFISNLISLVILFKIKEKQATYKYLKIYTLNGSFICSFLTINFYTRTPRFFEFALSYGAGIYRCKILFGLYTLVFWSNLISISILLERISNFKLILEKYFKNRAYTVIVIALIISFLIHIPTYFLYEIRNENEFKEAFENLTLAQSFPYCGRAKFSDTIYGNGVLFLVTVIRDFVLLGVEIALTIVSLVYLKKFFKKKQVILSLSQSLPRNMSHIPSEGSSSNQKYSKTKENLSDKVQSNSKRIDSIISSKRSNRKLTIMSMCFASLSIITNISSLVNSVVFLAISNGILFHQTSFVNVFSVILKYSLNFFLFFWFNTNFRKFIKKMFK
jgi:hypothetical protein